jgi:tight adherence protein C
MLPLLIAVGLTFFLGVTAVVLLLSGRSRAAARLAEVTTVQASGDDIRSRPADALVGAVSNFTSRVRTAVGLSTDSSVTKRLALAGYRDSRAVDLFYAARLFGPVLGAVIAGFVIKSSPFFWFIALGAIGFYAPDFWLTGAVKRRREAIRLGLPDALDLLAICMEAGLGLDQALIRVGQELRISHPQLSDEFMLINLEQRAGKPRLEAWRNMADRTGLEIVRSFVSMLVQTERFGTPISRSLGTFSDSLRTRRRQQAEEMAAKTTVKMIFPLVLFIFPSLFVVLLAPAIISITKSMGELVK